MALMWTAVGIVIFYPLAVVLVALHGVGLLFETFLLHTGMIALLTAGGTATGFVFRRRWTDYLAASLFVQIGLWPWLWLATTAVVPQIMFGSGIVPRPFEDAFVPVLVTEAVGIAVASLLVHLAHRWAAANNEGKPQSGGS